ncbi:MAG: tRNA (N6-threonylcarbamoyladenosine(37)-N6)-methyltransferase TrmO [Proteobacteria bacterium]|nr:MAG: tRNA (N6-threonylcarbamoyladenosine(37)-N6)-methyltransferase TrmO [Pseudomonadota bacterium]
MSERIRPGEVAVEIPRPTDAGVYFIGRIRTPWATSGECPKRGRRDGEICRIEVDPFWHPALQGLDKHACLQILYWMHLARRDLLQQNPGGGGNIVGTFAIRSPVRPNPIASSLVDLVGIEGGTLMVRGLDCIDGTPLIDIKPEFCPGKHRADDQNAA